MELAKWAEDISKWSENIFIIAQNFGIQSHNEGKPKIESFALINPSLLMFAVYDAPSKEGDRIDFRPRLVLYSIRVNPDNTTSLIHAQTLRLPPMHTSSFSSRRRVCVRRLIIRSDPLSDFSPSPSKSTFPYRDPTNRIFAIEMTTISRSPRYTVTEDSFSFCIPYKNIMASLSKASSEPDIRRPITYTSE